jgi:hypothetical protein
MQKVRDTRERIVWDAQLMDLGFIVDQIDIFCHELVNSRNEHVKDMSLWFNYLAYDIMGEVIFGRGFHMMTQTDLRYILPLIDDMVFSMLLVRRTTWYWALDLTDYISRAESFLDFINGASSI